MIRKTFYEPGAEDNYKYLEEDRKAEHEKYYSNIMSCPEEYVISVDVTSPHSKDQCFMITYDYEEYLKGNFVIKGIKHF